MRVLIELSTAWLAFLRHLLGLRIRPGTGLLKLNLGCGLAVHGDWVNVDGSLNMIVASLPEPFQRLAYRASGSSAYCSYGEYRRVLSQHTFFHANLALGIPANDESVDCIYSSHFLEHLYPADAARFMEECHRVLRPGGLVRICVPDLEHALTLYARGDKRAMLSKYFFVESGGSVLARHKYMYDLELLSDLLCRAGFHCVRRCAFGEGRVPEVAFLDNRPEDTLYVEAEK